VLPPLHVFTARSNPLYWKQPHKNWEIFAKHMLDSPNVILTVVECAYGAEDFACTAPPMSDPSHAERFRHIGVRAKTRGWNKECLLNLGVQRTPDAQIIAWIDADTLFRDPTWSIRTVRALQHYDVIQPWRTCYDLGPGGEHLAAHTSFCCQLFNGLPLAPDSWKEPYWQGDGGKHIYPHCLPGDSLVVPGGKVIAAAVRYFEGDLVVLRTASGQELACSPNHPILSGGCWKRADSINVGDNVLCHVRGNGSLSEPDKKQSPARIEDIVRAFSERPRMNRFANLLPDNLDNRRANSKVAEVWADRNLAAGTDTRSGQKRGDLALGRIVAMGGASRDGLRPHNLFGEGLCLALPPDSPTLSADVLPLFRRHLGKHPGADGAGYLAPTRRAVGIPSRNMASRGNGAGCSHDRVLTADLLGHAPFDDSPRVGAVHADDPRRLASALAGQVEADQIVYVGRRPFSGQLYDLQTEHGHIIADGIVTHNSGYAWAMTRQAFEWVGGLFEFGGMGSGDHHMALGLAGLAQKSLPPGPNTAYCEEVLRWGERAVRHINGNIGYTEGTIEHLWHGRKSARNYIGRWGMFVKHGFHPQEDLKRNAFGVLEFATNKPLLRRDFDRYLQMRNEDANSM